MELLGGRQECGQGNRKDIIVIKKYFNIATSMRNLGNIHRLRDWQAMLFEKCAKVSKRSLSRHN
jgi:hypothetical protein